VKSGRNKIADVSEKGHFTNFSSV